VFKVGLAVSLVCGAAIGAYMYMRMDDEIRRHVETLLAQRYPHLSVTVGSARVVEGRGIAVNDLRLADPSAPPGSDELLAIDELLLVCNVELSQLVSGAPEVDRIEVKQPRLTARRGRDGRWNLLALVPSQTAELKLPPIAIRGGALAISDETTRAAPVVLTDARINLAPTSVPSDASGPVRGFKVDGTVAGAQAKRIELHATIAAQPWRGTATVTLEQLQINPQLLAWTQAFVPARLRTTRVSGAIDGQLTLAWANLQSPPEVHGRITLAGGRVDDPRLPAPITDLAGRLDINGQQQVLTDLHGLCGAANVAASLNRTGWSTRSPLAISARADNVTLDAAIYRMLASANAEGLAIAGELCEQWTKFRPAGIVDATLQGTFDGQTWTPTAKLTGRNLSFESDKFASDTGAYRLTGGSGTIECLPPTTSEPKRVIIDLIGFSGQRPLSIEGKIIDPKPDCAGWVRITGEDIVVEQGMLDSIPNAKCREVIGQLHPAGRFNVRWELVRPEPGAPARTDLRLELTDIRVNYDQFPYPLRGVSGTITAHDNHWKFETLQSSGRRPVYGHGHLTPMPNGAYELALQFDAKQALLDDPLYDALYLNPSVQRLWTELNPWGELDVQAKVHYVTGQPRPNISVVLQPREGVQIKPKFFPYRMEQISGTATYLDGRVTLSGMRARNDRTVIATNGSGSIGPEGQWQFELSGLTADHVWPNAELTAAMPQRLRTAIERLKPTGNFTLHDGLLRFRKSASEIAPLEANWDLSLDCNQTDLQCGIELKGVSGSVRLMGESNGVTSSTRGELMLESVWIQDIQFTNVRGPLYINESRCLLGTWATDQVQEGKRPLTGNVYDGALTANAWVSFENLPAYQADLKVTGADLRRVLVERFRGQRQFNGKIDGDMVLGGRGYKVESLVGDGRLHLRDADLYELSLLASLLKMLRTGASDKTAFTEGDVAFRLQGRNIVLDQIDFLGDVVNLYGKGETNFNQNLNLVFSASILPHDSKLPLVNSFVKQTNPRMVQMYVNGTLSEPKVATEAFPGVAQMFQRLGADLRNPLEGVDQMQAERRRLAAQNQGTIQ
jgi:hypothetical protein